MRVQLSLTQIFLHLLLFRHQQPLMKQHRVHITLSQVLWKNARQVYSPSKNNQITTFLIQHPCNKNKTHLSHSYKKLQCNILSHRGRGKIIKDPRDFFDTKVILLINIFRKFFKIRFSLGQVRLKYPLNKRNLNNIKRLYSYLPSYTHSASRSFSNIRFTLILVPCLITTLFSRQHANKSCLSSI